MFDAETKSAMDKQSAEFDAMADLANTWHAVIMTPIVDDDYPIVRHRWERAVDGFLKACHANGRKMD